MKWWELVFPVPHETADAAAALLLEWPEVHGVSMEGNPEAAPLHPEWGEWFDESLLATEETEIRVYLPAEVVESFWRERWLNVCERLEQAGLTVGRAKSGATATLIDEDSWKEAWKDGFTALPVGERFVIVPKWLAAETSVDQRLPIVLEPGMAFGTGTHATTRLCLAALEQAVRSGQRILDVGCGTGVLAIGAAKLGAQSVKAIDIDPVAVSVATDNVRDNHVSNVVTVQQGDLLKGGVEAPYDGVIANILLDVVRALAPAAAEVLRPGGWFLASGFISAHIPAVEETLISHGFSVVHRWADEDWAALMGVKPS